MTAGVKSLDRAEVAGLAAARPDVIHLGPDDGRAALVGIARAYAHTPQHLHLTTVTARESVLDEAVIRVSGRFIAMHGLLVVAATVDPETVEDLLMRIDRARRLIDGDDLPAAHQVCCNQECDCTRPGRTGQPPGDFCGDCLSGLVADLEDKTEQVLTHLVGLFGAEVVTMAVLA